MPRKPRMHSRNLFYGSPNCVNACIFRIQLVWAEVVVHMPDPGTAAVGHTTSQRATELVQAYRWQPALSDELVSLRHLRRYALHGPSADASLKPEPQADHCHRPP